MVRYQAVAGESGCGISETLYKREEPVAEEEVIPLGEGLRMCVPYVYTDSITDQLLTLLRQEAGKNDTSGILNDDQRARALKVFKRIDLDRSGQIQFSEMVVCLI